MSDDGFDDLDDYIDDFVTESVLAETGASSAVQKDQDLDKLAELDPNLANELQTLVAQLDQPGVNIEKDGKNSTKNFKSALNDTINRIKESSETVDKESTKSMENANDEELLTTLLKSMDLGDLSGEDIESQADDLLKLLGKQGGEGSEEQDADGITNMLLDALTKLTGKDMLYDTVSQSCIKYEKFFQSHDKPSNGGNNDDLTLSDYLRYEAQYQHLKNIKTRFDSTSYSDDNKDDRTYVDAEMEKFNNLYPPPEEVMDDNLNALGVDNLKWGDQDVPFDQGSLDGCQQQ